MINGSQLKTICPSLSVEQSVKIANILDTICPKYGINTPDILHEFIARLAVECMEFTRFEENLNYSAESLKVKFGRHRISIEDCDKFGRSAAHKADKQALGNILYGGEWGKKNLGNTQQGDGYLFRGSGAIQATGRGIITPFTNYYNKQFGTSFTPEQMAVLLRTNIEIGIHSACWIFAVHFKLIDEAIDDKIKAIIKTINGGNNGTPETLVYLKRAQQVII